MNWPGADFFGRFLLLALLVFYGCTIVRSLQLKRRGILVHQPAAPRGTRGRRWDFLNFLVPTVRSYEIIACAWPLKWHLLPAGLRTPLFDFIPLKIGGVIAWTAALAVYLWAQASLGKNWRIGTVTDAALVTQGAFAWSRHPIYLAFALMAVGTFGIFSTVGFLLLAGVSLALLRRQVLREEAVLHRIYGLAYEDYCQRTGRYLTMRLRIKPNRNRP
jgi:protein-S-isoprenylcysteine O-methyltransferase Ste14